MTNRNEIARLGLSQTELDRLFARTGEELVRESDRRRRAAEWPSEVEALLAALTRKVATLEARLAQVEAHEAP